jgi:hypothetical protein
MILIKLKSKWNGMVAIREKYLNEAIKTKQGISMSLNGEIMDIKYNNLISSITARSKKPVLDKYSNETHYLIYFNWKPLVNQMKLL